ncbi:MAG TPA: SAM-dependent methyltransferase [Terriglobia bacterium]|nr:SAM-dependent methyltransferase [Terriglobia bacterium]
MTEGTASGQPGAGYTVDLTERVRLMRDSLINNSILFISTPVGIILVPIMVKGLGAEGYGLWVAASALGSMLWIDFGTQVSATRAIAEDRVAESPDEMPRFVRAAWSANLALGFLVALLIGVFGLALTQGLHLSAATISIAPIIFALVGLTYWGSQLLTFTAAVFNGLRRFDVANYLAIGTTLAGAAGVITVLKLGGSLVAVAVWQVLINWSSLLVSIHVVHRLEPRLQLGWGKFKWAWLRPYLSFGLWSQLSDFSRNSNLQAAPLLIGTVLNSSAISPFAVGQKFPTAVSRLQGRALDVIFPAASQSRDSATTRHLVEVGTRWMVVLMFPLYLGLIISAPKLLLAWMGEAPADTIAVLRLVCAGMAVAALGGGSEQVLWGRGEARKIFWANTAALAANLAVTFFALHRFGLQGAAWGFLASMTFRSMALLVLASGEGQAGVFTLLRSSLKSILIPLAACGVAAWGVFSLGWLRGWLGIMVASFAGGMAYGTGLYFGGARPEERMLAREVLLSPVTIVRFIWRSLRRLQRRIGPRYGAYMFLASIYRVLTYRPERVTAQLENNFARTVDPYHLDGKEDQERFTYELGMVDSVRGGARFKHALEIGCAEGVFTELLAPRCESLLGLDNSPIALARARERCLQFEFVQFDQWDMRRDPLQGKFDLIVVVGTLGHLHLPSEFRKVRAQIVDALLPGGYLLMGEALGLKLYENSWWAKRLLVGGIWIRQFMSEHPALKVVSQNVVDPWTHALYQKG